MFASCTLHTFIRHTASNAGYNAAQHHSRVGIFKPKENICRTPYPRKARPLVQSFDATCYIHIAYKQHVTYAHQTYNPPCTSQHCSTDVSTPTGITLAYKQHVTYAHQTYNPPCTSQHCSTDVSTPTGITSWTLPANLQLKDNVR